MLKVALLAGNELLWTGIYSSCDVLLFSSASLFVLLFIFGKGLNGDIKEFELGIPENRIKTIL